MNKHTITVYVHLLDEGSPVARGTEANALGNERYQLLAPSDYDPQDEVWQFPPGSIVRCEPTESAQGNKILLAVELTE